MDWMYVVFAVLALASAINIVAHVRSFRRGAETVGQTLLHVLDKVVWLALLGVYFGLYWSGAHQHYVDVGKFIRYGLLVMIAMAVLGVVKLFVGPLVDPKERQKIDELVAAYKDNHGGR